MHSIRCLHSSLDSTPLISAAKSSLLPLGSFKFDKTRLEMSGRSQERSHGELKRADTDSSTGEVDLSFKKRTCSCNMVVCLTLLSLGILKKAEKAKDGVKKIPDGVF